MRILFFKNKNRLCSAVRQTAMLAGVIVLACVLFWDNGSLYRAVSAEKREVPVYRVERPDKKVALSFDAAWGDESTRKLLDIMDRYGVRSTFFLVGMWIDAFPEDVKMIAERGFEIGNHSTNHPEMTKLNDEQMRSELETTSRKIKELTGQEVCLFRPPFGDYNNLLIDTARELGLTTIQWDVDSLDWKNLSAEEITSRVTEQVQPGSIVLFHNAGLNTPQALPGIIEYLQRNGYEIVPVGELLLEGETMTDAAGVQHPVV